MKPALSRKPALPSVKGVIETAHYLPGRLRLVVPTLAGDPESIENLERLMVSLDPVDSIRVSLVSGSVIIRFDSEVVEPVILFGAVARILGLDEQMSSGQKPVAWHELKTAGQAVDSAVYSKTAGYLDIKTLVTLLLLGVVMFRTATRTGRTSMPGTVTLGWWLFNLIFMRGIP